MPGKRYTDALKKRPDSARPLDQAVPILKGYGKTKFDQTVDLVMCLGIDPKQADQNLRGALSLPYGTGGSKRVVAFCSPEKIDEAKEAGAVEAGGEDLVEKVEGGWFDFDVAVAEPAMMRVVAKLGKTLGPKGLMPSPKSGTVTQDIVTAVKEYSAGKIEFRTDKNGNIHAPIGKQSFESEQLVANAQAFIDHIMKLKPASTKGHYVRKVAIAGTMTPSVEVAL
jgi:large subunit ribosomal protein L1